MSKCAPGHPAVCQCSCTAVPSLLCTDCMVAHLHLPGTHHITRLIAPLPSAPDQNSVSTGSSQAKPDLKGYLQEHKNDLVELLCTRFDREERQRLVYEAKAKAVEYEREIARLQSGTVSCDLHPAVSAGLEQLRSSLSAAQTEEYEQPTVDSQKTDLKQSPPAVVIPVHTGSFLDVASQLQANFATLLSASTEHITAVVPLLASAHRWVDFQSQERLKLALGFDGDAKERLERTKIGAVCVSMAEISANNSVSHLLSFLYDYYDRNKADGQLLVSSLEAITTHTPPPPPLISLLLSPAAVLNLRYPASILTIASKLPSLPSTALYDFAVQQLAQA